MKTAARSAAVADAHPFTVLTRGCLAAAEAEGALDGAVVGTSLRGVCSSSALRRAVLEALARRNGIAPDPRWGAPERPGARDDRLAHAVAAALDMAALAQLLHR